MTKEAQIEQQLIAYLHDELSADDRRALEERLAGDPSWQQRLSELREMHQLLAATPPPSVPDNVRDDYHRALGEMVEGLGERRAPQRHHLPAAAFWRHPRLWVGAAAVLLLGIFFGRLWSPAAPATQQALLPAARPLLMPIGLADLQEMTRFFQDAEMLVLQLANGDDAAEIVGQEWAFSREIAAAQLRRIEYMQQQAVALNDPRMLHILGQLEMLCYEIDNSSGGDEQIARNLLRETVNDTGLADALNEILNMLNESQPSGIEAI